MNDTRGIASAVPRDSWVVRGTAQMGKDTNMATETPRRDEQDNLEPDDQRLFVDGRDAWANNPNDPDAANSNPARDERDPQEEADTLAESIIGQNSTTDGTKESDGGMRNRR